MKNSILLFIFSATLFIGCTPKNAAKQSAHQYTNELINESSPYLLQHAHNPVNWYPWGEKALKKAKDEDKLMIISVGYAACHWCHVMEHESFEDSLVAKVMNDNFVCVKVDREERPDVDDVYMTACQLSSGKGCGWPLNAFALPDGRPVFAATYMPKKQWTQTLESFIMNYEKDSLRMVQYADQLTNGIEGSGSIAISPINEDFQAQSLNNSVENLIGQIDKKKGGRKGSPKFPMPSNYEFLMMWSDLYGNGKAMEAVTTTLDNMAYGGIYDQLGGGFARYSVDSEWLVPHFEKMLYDNSQLVSLYAKAYQKTKDPAYKRIVKETLQYIEREMTHESGGFYSSLDADSEGEEGKFYVWTKEEIEQILGDKAEAFNQYYDVRPMGNWEGHTILNVPSMTDEGMEPLQESKARLFVERAKRTRPGLDDKVLTSWNALMNMGYVDAYKALGDEKYKAAAIKNGEFILKTVMQKDGRLNRNYKDGKSVINAFLDDYALTIQAFAKLYEITFDEKWLNKAEELANYAMAHFYNKETKMFNYTSDLDPPLVAQKVDLSDNVIPGSNSSMAKSLVILGTYLYKTDYIDTAKQMLSNMESELVDSEAPSFYSNWLSVYQMIANPPYEIAIVGDDYDAKRNELMKHYLPNALLLGGQKEGNLELLKDKLQEGSTMIYVCQNKSCKLPTEEVTKALSLMK